MSFMLQQNVNSILTVTILHLISDDILQFFSTHKCHNGEKQ